MLKPSFYLVFGIVGVVVLVAVFWNKLPLNSLFPIAPSATPIQTDNQAVPLPQETDIIRTFFNLIDQGEAAKAVDMMSRGNTDNDSTRQAWGVQFAAFDAVKVITLEPFHKESWTEKEHLYRTILEVAMNPASAVAAIPYFGYDNGENTRWVQLVRENNLWKIGNLSTGP